MDMKTVNEWIQYACDCNGCPEIAKRIRFEWNSRFTKRAGDCGIDLDRPWDAPLSCVIRLSIPLWPRMDENERIQTIIHEACHAITTLVYKGSGHGYVWRQCMRKCGVPDNVYHNIDRTGLRRSKPKVAAVCACGEHPMGPIRARRMKQGMQYKCRNCHTIIRLR